jgi:hypothetical protein
MRSRQARSLRNGFLRLYNAFATDQNARQHCKHILAFIRHAMKPERYIRAPHRFEPMRSRLNQALLFAGLVVSDAGTLMKTERAGTLSESRRRADELRADLTSRGVHPDVLNPSSKTRGTRDVGDQSAEEVTAVEL